MKSAWSSFAFAFAMGTVSAMQGGAALAQDARALFQQGQAAYQQGDYEDAITAFERAYALDPRPALQFNIAQAYGRLGRMEEERAALVAYVDGSIAAGTARDDAQIVSARARIDAIGERIARTGVELHGVPADARVVIDSEPVALTLGESVRLAPGSHEIVVSVDGYQDFSATVSVRPGETLDVAVRLRRASETGDGEDEDVSHVASYALWGAGGALMLTGTILGVSAMSRARDASPGTADADGAKGLAVGADLCLFGGGAVAVSGLVVFFVQRGESEPRAAFVPTVTREGASVGVFGRF